MKRQKDGTLKDELPRSIRAQYVTGDQWRNSSRKNEEMEPKQKQHPAGGVTGDGSKVWCCKQQYCIGTWSLRSMNQCKLEVVKQETASLNIDILVISELKWTGRGEFNSDDHYIYYCGQKSLRRNGVAIIVNKRIQNAVLGCNLKNNRMISVHFQGKPFNITVIQVYAPRSNAEEAEVEWFYDSTRPSRNYDDVITQLKPDILECEVKWTLGSITTNKAHEGDGIPVELFQVLKDDAVKVLHSICQQIWKTQQGPQDWKRSIFILISIRKAMPKNAQTTAQLHSFHTLAK